VVAHLRKMEILEKIKEIFRKYFDAQKRGDIKELVALYRELILSRNSLAVDQGYKDYLDMQIKKINRIPEPHWQKYLANKDAFATKFSPHLDSSSNSPHFLSKLPELKIEYPENVFDLVTKKYPEINEVRNKISIENSDKGAYFRYSDEADHYSIYIPQTNFNQKVSMLIHELAHVISWEKQHHRVESIYSAEFEAHQIEFALTKDISNEFSQAVFGEYLMGQVRSDFQIAIFTNTTLDPIVTYTENFAKYIGELKKENQTDFLFDKKITHDPLVDLSSAVSIVNLLT